MLPSLRHRHHAALLVLASATLALSGCNLALNLDDYPYRGNTTDLTSGDMTTADAPADMPDMDADMDMGAPIDMNVSVPVPDLIITEILIDSSFPEEGMANAETGEYIEVYNRGNSAALLTRLYVQSDAGSNNLFYIRPGTTSSSIDAGEYFVFVRSVDPEFGIIPHIEAVSTGMYYDWGGNGSSLALTNPDRQITIKYEVDPKDSAKDVTLDTIAWAGSRAPASTGSNDGERGLPIVENLAISLAPEHYRATAEERKVPGRWCYDQSATLGMVGLRGSPGRLPIAERCTPTDDPLP